MLLLRIESLPSGEQWVYELKLDGYRAIAFKRDGIVSLRSETTRTSTAVPRRRAGARRTAENTVIDGEIVSLDDEGRPSFNALQNYGAMPAQVMYYVFDMMVLAGRDVKNESLDRRRELLENRVLPKLVEPVRYIGAARDRTLPVLIESVKAHGLEGLVAKRRNSRYEAGLRSGRVDEDARQPRPGIRDRWLHRWHEEFRRLVFGYYEGGRLIYAARTRNGFTPASARQLFRNYGARRLRVSVRQPAGGPERPMGPRSHESEDGRVPLAEARTRRPVRVPRMDSRQSPAALEIRRPAGRQESERRSAGMTLTGFAHLISSAGRCQSLRRAR